MGASVSSRLARCFVLAFPGLRADEAPRATVANLPAWDSLALVTLVALIEEEFGLKVDSDDLDEFISFDLIRGYLERRVGEHGP